MKGLYGLAALALVFMALSAPIRFARVILPSRTGIVVIYKDRALLLTPYDPEVDGNWNGPRRIVTREEGSE